MRYRSSSAYNQLLIAHIISKIIFMKYLPSGRPKLAPKLKMLRIYWHLAQLIFHRVGMIFHLIFQAWAFNFIKKETLAQVFSCEFCEIFKNTFSYRTHLMAASEIWLVNNFFFSRIRQESWKFSTFFPLIFFRVVFQT